MNSLLAWLFNESPSKDYVVTNDRWGQGTGQKHGSVYSGPDRWQPGSLIEHKWESAMTIDQKSWGIRRNIKIEDVLTPQELISQVSIFINTQNMRNSTFVDLLKTEYMQL